VTAETTWEQRQRERERERNEARRAATTEAFKPWLRYLSLGNYGLDVPAFRRLKDALWARTEHRNVHGLGHQAGEVETMAVRVVAETLANEVQASQQPEHDAATIAWVVAGLRCPRRPFCLGCSACFTITSPERPNDPPPRSPW